MPLRFLLAVGLLAALTSGCEPEPGHAPAPAAVTVGLPFRPDVQFAPFYLAQARGYFRDAGLDVSFEYGDESNLLRLAAAGEVLASVASGEQVILARASDIPVRYVMTWYRRFPVVVFSLDPALDQPAALVGRTVGLPARSGASGLGWDALLSASGVDPTAVETEVIGFTQREAVAGGSVDAAVGYACNEPLQLQAEGEDVSVIAIADYVDFVANGVVVGSGTIADAPERVAGLVDGLRRAIEETHAEPGAAMDAAMAVVAGGEDPAVRRAQRAVLDCSLAFWDATDVGAIDRPAWESTQAFLLDAGLIQRALTVDELVTDVFVDGTPAER
jgi:NitT/TauT family transport system substrate-binding protein